VTKWQMWGLWLPDNWTEYPPFMQIVARLACLIWPGVGTAMITLITDSGVWIVLAAVMTLISGISFFGVRIYGKYALGGRA